MQNNDGDIVGSFFIGMILAIFLMFLLVIPVAGIENHCDDLGTLMAHKTQVISNVCTVDMGNNQWVPVDELSLTIKGK